MARTNRPSPTIRTHEGAPAKRINLEQQLRRSIMSCLLYEKEFYEDGEDIATRIASIIPKVDPMKVYNMAVEAREEMHLRHVPLLIAREMVRHPTHRGLVGDLLDRIIIRADELAEFLAIYWANGKIPIAAQVKKGLARAFTKFDEYALAKYNRDGQIKLRDVLFLTHPKPNNAEQAALWKRLVDGELATPDTWEVGLSSGKDKKATWTRLIEEERLGGMATLRNLRNFEQAGVDESLIRRAISQANYSRVLPFRFIAAARYAQKYEPELEQALFAKMEREDTLEGKTVILVDVSGSMDWQLSDRSDMKRYDAAYGLAMILREICDVCEVYSFSNYCVQVAPRRGFALRDAIMQSQHNLGTHLGAAVEAINKKVKHDRLVVITDEQSCDRVPDPVVKNAYMLNVASAQNGVGYYSYVHIDGFSEAVVRYIQELEESGIY